jgi:hypothetical protein
MLSDTTTLSFPPDGQAAVPLIFDPPLLRCSAAGPGGRRLSVLIDTGTDPSAIDLGLARRLGLRLGEFALGTGAASDSVPYTETVLPWLRLGALEVRDLFALALDLRATPFDVDVVLGYNVLRQLVLHIDYGARRLLLRHPDLGAPPTPGAQPMPLVFHEHFPAFVDVLVDGGVGLPLATIDTGSNGGLTVGPDVAARLGLTPGADDVTYAQGAGFGGGCVVALRRGARIQVGPFALDDIALEAPGGASGDLARSGRANLGNGALSRFESLTIDYGRALAWAAERKG